MALCDQQLYYRYIWWDIPLRYSLNSHCFEEYPDCHNRTRTPLSLLILASNSPKRITCTKISIVFPYRCFFAFALLLVANKTFLSLASCLRSSAIGRDERKRCFHFRKLFVIKLSEGACGCLRQSHAHMETADEKFRMNSHGINLS